MILQLNYGNRLFAFCFILNFHDFKCFMIDDIRH